MQIFCKEAVLNSLSVSISLCLSHICSFHF